VHAPSIDTRNTEEPAKGTDLIAPSGTIIPVLRQRTVPQVEGPSFLAPGLPAARGESTGVRSWPNIDRSPATVGARKTAPPALPPGRLDCKDTQATSTGFLPLPLTPP
jgi:hypothetical protein